jgi:sec-independent protein translocase protein TatB
MFDIGFSEILVIAVVALIVIGPERLPRVARTLGHLLGRMQRYVNDVKSDIAREMEIDELKKLQTNVEDAARSIEQAVSRDVTAAQSQLSGVEQAITGEAAAVLAQAEAIRATEAAAITAPAEAPSSQAAQAIETAGDSRKQA